MVEQEQIQETKPNFPIFRKLIRTIGLNKTYLVSVPVLTLILIFGDFFSSGFSTSYFNEIPLTFMGLIGSRWAFFVFLSFFITIWWNILIPNGVKTEDYISFMEEHISVPSLGIQMVVFECNPPLINQIQELKFLTTTFRPLSIEIKWKSSSLSVMLYGIKGKKFELKIKECHKFLETYFTRVRLLHYHELEQFYGKNNLVGTEELKPFYTKTELKEIFIDISRDSSIISQSNTEVVSRMWFINRSNLIKKDRTVEDKFYGGDLRVITNSINNEGDNSIASKNLPAVVFDNLRLTPKDKTEHSVAIGEETILYLIYTWIKTLSKFKRSTNQHETPESQSNVSSQLGNPFIRTTSPPNIVPISNQSISSVNSPESSETNRNIEVLNSLS